MTDLSKLADDLIALINSKPRSPTRDEIVAVLSSANPVTHTFTGADIGGPAGDRAYVFVTGGGRGVSGGGSGWKRPPDWSHTYRITQAALEIALSCDNGHDFEDSPTCHRCGASQYIPNRKAWDEA